MNSLKYFISHWMQSFLVFNGLTPSDGVTGTREGFYRSFAGRKTYITRNIVYFMYQLSREISLWRSIVCPIVLDCKPEVIIL